MRLNNKVLILLSIVVIVGLFFAFPIMITPDSALYYWYTNIFNGSIPISSWNIVRGPIMGLLIQLGLIINKKIGFQLLSCIAYILTMFLIYWFLNYVDKKIVKLHNWWKIIYCVLIIFNPLIYGYFHLMLTEFLAILLSTVSLILSYFYIDVSITTDKKKFLIYNLAFCFVALVLWFLKQPYVSIILISLGVVFIQSLIRNRDVKNIASKGMSLLLIGSVLVLGIKVWNTILEKNGVQLNTSKNNQSFITTGIISGVTNFHKVQDENKNIEFIDGLDLSKQDKEKLKEIHSNKSIYKDYDIYQMYNMRNDSIVETVVLYKEGDVLSVKEAVNFYFKYFKQHPILYIEGYISNYLAIINIYPTGALRADLSGDYYPIKHLTINSFENSSIGLSYLYSNDNYLWEGAFIDNEDYLKNNFIENTQKDIKISQAIKKPLQYLGVVHLQLFKIVFLLAPVYTIYYTIKSRKNLTNKFNVLLKFGFACASLQVMFYAFFGALIDRYVIPAFPFLLAIYIIAIFKKGEKHERSKKR